MFLVLVNSIVFPITMCFYGDDFDNKFANWFDNFSIICFWIDIILNFRTTYYDADSNEVVNGKLIAREYISSITFWIDLLAAIPF